MLLTLIFNVCTFLIAECQPFCLQNHQHQTQMTPAASWMFLTLTTSKTQKQKLVNNTSNYKYIGGKEHINQITVIYWYLLESVSFHQDVSDGISTFYNSTTGASNESLTGGVMLICWLCLILQYLTRNCHGYHILFCYWVTRIFILYVYQLKMLL